MFRNVSTPTRQTDTPIPVIRQTILEKDTGSGPKGKFVTLVRTNMWKTKAAKRPKKPIVRRGSNQNLIGRLNRINRRGQSINDIDSSLKGKLPITKGKPRVSKKGETHINNVTMASLNSTHLVMGVRA